MKKVFIFVGTRPEAIKMSPIYMEMKKRQNFNPILVSSGQHKEMLSQALNDFGLQPDIDLNLMTTGQTLSSLSARLFERIDSLLERESPDVVLVQGDTTTVQVASLVSFYRKIPVGHVEAGLRSHDILSPFPEELNRRITGLVANWHFAPTQLAAQNLISEGIDPDNICVSGNTVIDSLLWTMDQLKKDPPELTQDIQNVISEGRKIILVTGHRRESFGKGFENICSAIEEIAKRFPDIRVIYPVHLNPEVRKIVLRRLSNHNGIILTAPLSYRPFLQLMSKSHLILSDSGGIQEEAPSLGKPLLIMRNVTERPEGISAGVNFLVGTDKDKILKTVTDFLLSDDKYKSVTSRQNPFGDGHASSYIIDFLEKKLGLE